MTQIIVTDRVRKGDCPWSVAQRHLHTKQQKVNNAQIIAEINRLTELNDCENVQDFQKKFFYSVGKEIILEKDEQNKKEQVKKDAAPKAKEQQSKPVVKKETPEKNTQGVKKEEAKKTEAKKAAPQKTTQPPKAEQTNPVQAKPVQKKNANEKTAPAKPEVSDEQKIISFNKKNYKGEYYGIVDKKNALLRVYSKAGNVVSEFDVGLGKSRGDNLQSNSSEAAKDGSYTTPGEFTLDDVNESKPEYTVAGNSMLMYLRGDNRGQNSKATSIHIVSTKHPERNARLQNGKSSDNRVTNGDINLTQENYHAMKKFLEEGDKLYVLPEEKGNTLQLTKQKDGSVKFEQKYHKADKRGISKAQASKVTYDIRDDRDPDFNFTPPVEKQKVCWYNPKTWF